MENVSKMVFTDFGSTQPDAANLSKIYEVSQIQRSFSLMKHVVRTFAKFVPREVVRDLVVNDQVYIGHKDFNALIITVFSLPNINLHILAIMPACRIVREILSADGVFLGHCKIYYNL